MSMTVFERQACGSKIAFRSISPVVDLDCTRCRQNRPTNSFAVNGERDTYKKKVYLDDLWYYKKMLELNSVRKL